MIVGTILLVVFALYILGVPLWVRLLDRLLYPTELRIGSWWQAWQVYYLGKMEEWSESSKPRRS